MIVSSRCETNPLQEGWEARIFSQAIPRRVPFQPSALEALRQVAIFFTSDGALVIQPEPARFFEVPISVPPPEGLNYIP